MHQLGISISDFSVYNSSSCFVGDATEVSTCDDSTGSLCDDSISPLSPLGGDIGQVLASGNGKFMSTADKMKLHAPSSSLSTPSKVPPSKKVSSTQPIINSHLNTLETPSKICESESSVLSPQGVGLITPVGKFQSTADKMKLNTNSSHRKSSSSIHTSSTIDSSLSLSSSSVSTTSIPPSSSISSTTSEKRLSVSTKTSLKEYDFIEPTSDSSSSPKLKVEVVKDKGSGETTFHIDNVMSASARRHSSLQLPPSPPPMDTESGASDGPPRTPVRQRAFSLKNPFTMSVQKTSMKEKKLPIRQSIEVTMFAMLLFDSYMFIPINSLIHHIPSQVPPKHILFPYFSH